MQVGEHGVLQRYPGLLLQRLEGLGVVVLAEVFEAKADGFLLSVLQGHDVQEGGSNQWFKGLLIRNLCIKH